MGHGFLTDKDYFPGMKKVLKWLEDLQASLNRFKWHFLFFSENTEMIGTKVTARCGAIEISGVLDEKIQAEVAIPQFGTYTITNSFDKNIAVVEVTTYGIIRHELCAEDSWRYWARLGGLNPDDYGYLARMLLDAAAMQRLANTKSAVDYLLTCKDTRDKLRENVIGSSNAMKYHGLSSYATKLMIDSPIWLNLILNSQAARSGWDGSGPLTPAAALTISDQNMLPYKFVYRHSNIVNNGSVIFANGNPQIKLQGSDNKSAWSDMTGWLAYGANNNSQASVNLKPNKRWRYYRILTSGYNYKGANAGKTVTIHSDQYKGSFGNYCPYDKSTPYFSITDTAQILIYFRVAVGYGSSFEGSGNVVYHDGKASGTVQIVNISGQVLWQQTHHDHAADYTLPVPQQISNGQQIKIRYFGEHNTTRCSVEYAGLGKSGGYTDITVSKIMSPQTYFSYNGGNIYGK